jgi:phosphonate transport system substrate-binding protein
MDGYRLGAVVYHEKVERIWDEFGAWFAEQGFALAPRFYARYEDQVADLLAGELDTAWNTNLAHVTVLRAAPGDARALAMRDTDRGWRSLVVARADSGLRSLDDLRGRSVGFGDADSPQAHILPVHALRAAGFDPARDCVATRLDRDVGKHGDTGGAELAQLARVRARELDACVVSSVTWEAVERLGDRSDLAEVWSSPPFHHCCFTVVRADERHDRFRELLLSMDASDPKLCEPMELEYVNRWVEFDPSGYRDLIDAVEAGPELVGERSTDPTSSASTSASPA